VIDRALTKRMEVMVGDRNPRYSEQKKGQAEIVVLCGSTQAIPRSSTIESTSNGNDVESLGLNP